MNDYFLEFAARIPPAICTALIVTWLNEWLNLPSVVLYIFVVMLFAFFSWKFQPIYSSVWSWLRK